MKRIFKILIVNAIVVVSLFIILELSVRLIYPQINLAGTSSALLKDNVYYDSPGLTPNIKGISYSAVKETDPHGFWKYSGIKTTGKKVNWLLLGDSATMGIGVENDSTFAGILDAKLDSIQILNPALIGYSSKDYLNIVKKLIEENKNELAIKELIIFWCLNDVYSNYPTNDSPDIRSKGIIGQVFQLISKNLKTWHLLKETFSDRQKDYFDYDKQFYAVSDTILAKSLDNIIHCSIIAKKYGIDTKLILLPYEYQIRYISNENNREPQKIMMENFSGTGIHVTDILQLVDDKKINSKSLYLFGDGIHFSNKGHKFIAGLLLENKILSTN